MTLLRLACVPPLVGAGRLVPGAARRPRKSDDSTALGRAGRAAEQSDESEDAETEEPIPRSLERVDREAPIPTRVMADRGVIDRAVRASVERGDYRFCTDPRFRLRRGDRDLCALAEAAAARCPEFRAACERPDDASAAASSKPRERPKPEQAERDRDRLQAAVGDERAGASDFLDPGRDRHRGARDRDRQERVAEQARRTGRAR